MNPLVELALAILLAAGTVYFVLLPIFRVTPSEGEGEEEGGSEGEEDQSPRAVALRALKEIEFDRATGKLSDADYDALKKQYTTLALEALRDAGGGMRDAADADYDALKNQYTALAVEALRESEGARGQVSGVRVSDPRHLAPDTSRACPTHGPRSEPGAQFCAECGRRLSSAHGFCGRCGAALEAEAHFCNACGARVAA